MRKFLLLGAAIFATTFAAYTGVSAQQTAPLHADGATLPAGPELDALQNSCRACHSFNMVTQQRHDKHTGKRGCPQQNGSAPSNSAALATCQHDGSNCKSFRNFMEKNGEKNDPSQPVRNDKAGSNGDPVEKRVDDQCQQNRIAVMTAYKLIRMGFFSEMKMRGDSMLEEMNDQITEQDQKCRAPATQFETGGNDFYDRRGQHESGAERDEVLQVSAFPMLLNNDRAAKNVCRSSGQAQ